MALQRMLVKGLVMVSLLASAGCGVSSLEDRSHTKPTLLAYGRTLTDVGFGENRASEIRVKVARVPAVDLQDPFRLALLRQRMERQIVSQTGMMPGARYAKRVRPLLARALRESGLLQTDVDSILQNVDQARRM